MICPYKCIHCNGKLKINKDAYHPPTNYPLVQWDCPKCQERCVIGHQSSSDYSRFCIAYQKTPESLMTGTNELYALEFNLSEYRVLVNHADNKTTIATRARDLIFTTAGAIKAWVYKNPVIINEVVKFDLTDKESMSQKIKLLLTFS